MSFIDFLGGVAFATFAASGIFFFKFWKVSKDRFFLLFCVACWILAVERLALRLWLGNLPVQSGAIEASSWIYLIRVAAFLLLIVAIVDKNRKRA